MWERWKKGESLQQIAQLFDRNHSSVNRILAETGGIRPAQRCRSQLALTLAEREEISRALVAGQSIRSIAAFLGRSPSTISREIKRNGGHGCYRATQVGTARESSLAQDLTRQFTSANVCSRPEAHMPRPTRPHSIATARVLYERSKLG